MLLKSSNDFDFEMEYYNANGKAGTMCGNGGRCITFYAKEIGIIKDHTIFWAIDGEHEAEIKSTIGNKAIVSLRLSDVDNIKKSGEHFLIDTGSPHYVQFVDDINKVDIFQEGRKLRWDEKFQPAGVNVNFVEMKEDKLIVRTFERGVENVTLSCGTGVTASAIAASLSSDAYQESFNIETYGGDLIVGFLKDNDKFSDVWLEGPAIKVFEGITEI